MTAGDLRGLGEPVAGVGHEGIEPDPLGACPMAEVMAILIAAARGEAHVDPVGGPSGKAGGIDEGLGQEGTDAVGGRPITDDSTQGECEHLAGEVFDPQWQGKSGRPSQ